MADAIGCDTELVRWSCSIRRPRLVHDLSGLCPPGTQRCSRKFNPAISTLKC